SGGPAVEGDVSAGDRTFADTDHVGLRPTVQKELLDRVASLAEGIQATAFTLEIGKAEQMHGFIQKAARKGVDESTDRGGYSDYRANPGWNFFNIDTGESRRGGHFAKYMSCGEPQARAKGALSPHSGQIFW